MTSSPIRVSLSVNADTMQDAVSGLMDGAEYLLSDIERHGEIIDMDYTSFSVKVDHVSPTVKEIRSLSDILHQNLCRADRMFSHECGYGESKWDNFDPNSKTYHPKREWYDMAVRILEEVTFEQAQAVFSAVSGNKKKAKNRNGYGNRS